MNWFSSSFAFVSDTWRSSSPKPRKRRSAVDRRCIEAIERLENRTLLDASVSGADLALLDLTAELPQVQERIVSAGRPRNYVITANTNTRFQGAAAGTLLNGVADLTVFTSQGVFGCTGSLLSTGRHILTAAHCVTNNAGNLNASSVNAHFELASGNLTISGSNITVHPSFNGNVLAGGDIAIIELDSVVPGAVTRYDIYRASNEIGKVGAKAGYGRFGRGNNGDTSNSNGHLRAGYNRYDTGGETLGFAPGTQLMFDFDNGNPENDAFGVRNGIHGLGLGDREVNSAPGDSGGPTFIDQKIAGVTSYGLLTPQTDIDNTINSSFGEISGDTRVSFYADFVDAVLAGALFTGHDQAAGSSILVTVSAIRNSPTPGAVSAQTAVIAGVGQGEASASSGDHQFAAGNSWSPVVPGPFSEAATESASRNQDVSGNSHAVPITPTKVSTVWRRGVATSSWQGVDS